MPTCVGESGFKRGSEGLVGSEAGVKRSFGSGEAVGDVLGSTGSPVCLWEDGRTSLQQASLWSQAGMAVTRPFFPC